MLYRKIFILSYYLGNKHFLLLQNTTIHSFLCVDDDKREYSGLGHVSQNTNGIYLFRQCNNKSDDNRMHLCNRCYVLTSDWIQISCFCYTLQVRTHKRGGDERGENVINHHTSVTSHFQKKKQSSFLNTRIIYVIILVPACLSNTKTTQYNCRKRERNNNRKNTHERI